MWNDPWVPQLDSFKPLPLNDSISLEENLRVSELFIPNTRVWNETMVRALFRREDAKGYFADVLPSIWGG